MPAEITRRREVRDRIVLDVEADGQRYQVWIVPCKGMNYEISGYRVWFGPALPITGEMDEAESRALRAIGKLHEFVPRIDASVLP